MTDIIYKKLGATRLYQGFRVKLMVFMALINCFPKKSFLYFLIYAFICYLFVAQRLIVAIQKSIYFLGGINEPRHFFQLLSNVCYVFEYVCFKKISVNF